jgi:GTP-binding protein
MVPADADDIAKEYRILLGELEAYNPELLDKSRILAISKSDLLDNELKSDIRNKLPDLPHIFISSITGEGIKSLKEMLWQALNE